MNLPSQNQVNPSVVVIACSGPADVGGLADRVARRLNREGLAQMIGTAGINAEIPSTLQAARKADFVLLIDGCSNNCARKCMENMGVTVHAYMCLTALGYIKGHTPQPEEILAKACAHAQTLLPPRK